MCCPSCASLTMQPALRGLRCAARTIQPAQRGPRCAARAAQPVLRGQHCATRAVPPALYRRRCAACAVRPGGSEASSASSILAIRVIHPPPWRAACPQCSECRRDGPRFGLDSIRLYHELANPCPGFLVIPILKRVVGQLLAFIGPAIQHYSWEVLGAGEGIKPATLALGVQTGVSSVRWPKQNTAARVRTQESRNY
jgi:hypothetical protein